MSLAPSALLEVAGRIWPVAIELALQVAIAAALVAIAALALRRATPRVRHALWLVLLLRLALPVPVSTPVGLLARASEPIGPPPAMDEVVALDAAPPAGTPAVPNESTPPARETSLLPAIALALWTIGAALAAGLTLFRTARVRRALRAAPPAGAALRREIAGLAREFRLSRLPAVRLVPDGAGLPAPALFGLLRPVLLLPAETASLWTERERRAVLLHELIHLERRDHLVHALQAFVRAVYFFHPFAWIVQRGLAVERELACDDEVVRRTGTPDVYARALLRLAERRQRTPSWVAAGVGMAERPLSLPRRLERMSNPSRSHPHPVRHRAAIAGAVLVALLSIAFAAGRAAGDREPVASDDTPIAAEILSATGRLR